MVMIQFVVFVNVLTIHSQNKNQKSPSKNEIEKPKYWKLKFQKNTMNNALKRSENLRINLTKIVQDLSTENSKALLEKIFENLKK